MPTIMKYCSGIAGFCILIIFVIYNLVAFKIDLVEAQNHKWVTNYTSCSKPCGGGVQTLNKYCYTVEPKPKLAFPSYCSSLPINEPSKIPCNTQACSLCERTFSTLSGTITSPYYPDKFTLPTNCKLSIQLPTGKRVVLAFKEFILEGISEELGLTEEKLCICGTLTLVSDPNFEEIKDELCGTKRPFVWVSQSNEVNVEFLTESHSVFNRFDANYTAINGPLACYQFIDLTKGGPSGFLTSLNFPNHYEDGMDCEYIILADPVHRIVLFFETFQLEPSPNWNCENDYLKVSDLYSWRSDTYCGTRHSFAWVSDSNGVWIVFHTNDVYVYEGFLIAYEVIDRDYFPLVFTQFPGQITSPGYPLTYPAFTKFEYLIHAKPSQMIVITFNDFHLEAPHTDENDEIALCDRLGFTDTSIESCQSMIAKHGNVCGRRGSLPCTKDTAQDFVELLDVYFNENAMFCGYLPTFSWMSRGSEVLLRFFTDENENFRGFNASYRTEERRPPVEWELVFRVAMGSERSGVGKWLDTTQGYNEYLPQAQQTTIGGFSQTYKNSIVNDWEHIGVQKVKVELYTKGRVVATFFFDGSDSTNLIDWFTCENLIYSPYSDLGNCTGLVFEINDQGFEIANELGADGYTCNAVDGLMWLDFQEANVPSYICSYESAAKSGAQFFYSTSKTGSPTSTGAGMEYADVFTIWIQRDCDQHFTLTPTATRNVYSEGFGHHNYPNNEHCDVFVATDPLERISFAFLEFILQTDCENERDYVEIEDLTLSYAERFCGKQSNVEWTTMGNTAVLRFRTDASINYAGFSATVSSEVRNAEDCSSVINTAWGNITNLHYPSSPREFRRQGCETLIHSHPDDRVVITFDKFHFEFDIGPEFVISDTLGSEVVVPVSGTLYPFSWTSASNELAFWYYPRPFKSYLLFSARHRRLAQPLPAGCLEFYNGEFYGTFTWPMLAMPTGSQNCYIVIRTQPVLNRRITLTFNNFVLQLQECNAYVEAIDTTTYRSDMYCTTAQHPFTWTSDANEVVVKFYHGPVPALHQLFAEYDSLQRVEPKWYKVLTEDTGHFSSPRYPKLYPSNVPLSEFLLHANAHQLIVVVFTDFGIEGPDSSGKCQYDFVRIYDLLDNREECFCGDQPPFGWCSTGNEVLVTLIVDETAQKRGFYANYAFLPRPDPSTCGGLFLESTGQMTSPNYPRSYGDNQHCVYVIQAPADKRIVIEFSQLVLEPDANCQKDYLKVKDKISGRKDVYCGEKTVPFTWRSRGNVVVMVFVSDLAYSKYSGFVSTYKTKPRDDLQTCVQELAGESGIITSPRFPHSYYNNADCRYEITVAEEYGILLSFVEFTLEPANPSTLQCDFDYVGILDENGQSTGKLCGSKGPFQRRLSSNVMTILFRSDYISFYKGFRASYEQVDLTTPPPDCDQLFTGTSGVFTSPNYPGNYPEDTLCQIRIIVGENLRIKITFTDFSLEGHPNCPYDYVEVTDVTAGIKEKYCGRLDGPIEWQSESNKVLVIFRSDERTPSSGFSAIYETEPKPAAIQALTGCESPSIVETNAPWGQLTSPNYPRPYELNQKCHVRIVLRSGQACKIIFTEFDLEDHPKCSYDFVELTSFPDGTSQRFCGKPIVPLTWMSKGPICEVVFSSDGYVTAGGYKAIYDAIIAAQQIVKTDEARTTEAPPASDCNQELHGTSGSFTTPNYPANYPLNEKCTTRILVPSGYIVEITFHTLDVEDEPKCHWDYVQIVDVGAGGKSSQKHCGNYKQSFTYTSASNDVNVNFVSDNWETRQGYSASYKAVSAQLIENH